MFFYTSCFFISHNILSEETKGRLGEDGRAKEKGIKELSPLHYQQMILVEFAIRQEFEMVVRL